jgi:hypothetical protein
MLFLDLQFVESFTCTSSLTRTPTSTLPHITKTPAEKATADDYAAAKAKADAAAAAAKAIADKVSRDHGCVRFQRLK